MVLMTLAMLLIMPILVFFMLMTNIHNVDLSSMYIIRDMPPEFAQIQPVAQILWGLGVPEPPRFWPIRVKF